MTKEEAVIKYRSVYTTSGWDTAMRAVEALAALGILKFDEPKVPSERAIDAMFKHESCLTSGLLTPRQALEAIRSAGLTIVEQ